MIREVTLTGPRNVAVGVRTTTTARDLTMRKPWAAVSFSEPLACVEQPWQRTLATRGALLVAWSRSVADIGPRSAGKLSFQVNVI
jgi:hypothetical protein